MGNVLQRRINRALGFLRAEPYSAALLLGSVPPARKSRDSQYPYRPQSDLYYLTGSENQNIMLLLLAGEKRPILLCPPQNAHTILWEGAAENGRAIANRIGADLIVSSTPEKEVFSRLKGIETLFFQNDAGAKVWEIAQQLLSRPSFQRLGTPQRFIHSDVILEPLRLIKDKEEIQLMRKAALVTNAALRAAIPLIRPGQSERAIHAQIELTYFQMGCEVAFPSIIASGKSAATLHHSSSQKRLKRGELLLMDVGAECQRYAADITRVVPVSGTFDALQTALYEVVLEAQKAALARVRPGSEITSVYAAAARAMTIGLKDLGVLRGRLSDLLKKRAFLPFFPHSIGHTLGLDVHDIGNLRDTGRGRLQTGMVLTIEPGLYFQKPRKKIPACGIRIEDDVRITERGHEVLTPEFPKSIREIEKLFR